jgi:glutamine amidotransferase
MQVKIIDYDCGNLYSVRAIFEHLGADASFIKEPEEISGETLIVLPGVGHFRHGVTELKNRGLDTFIKEQVGKEKVQILGICLGMQLLCESSEEAPEDPGLGIVPGYFSKFSNKEDAADRIKIPHIGFNNLNIKHGDHWVFEGLCDNPDFYFNHSYYYDPGSTSECPDSMSTHTCEHGTEFVAVFAWNNVIGCQFHPEKSQSNGMQLLSNIVKKGDSA